MGPKDIRRGCRSLQSFQPKQSPAIAFGSITPTPMALWSLIILLYSGLLAPAPVEGKSGFCPKFSVNHKRPGGSPINTAACTTTCVDMGTKVASSIVWPGSTCTILDQNTKGSPAENVGTCTCDLFLSCPGKPLTDRLKTENLFVDGWANAYRGERVHRDPLTSCPSRSLPP